MRLMLPFINTFFNTKSISYISLGSVHFRINYILQIECSSYLNNSCAVSSASGESSRSVLIKSINVEIFH